MVHSVKIKIYYEDTDCGGVVYYGNYLGYFERARTEFLESRGVSLKKLMDEGVYFVVAAADLKYLAPARYGDVLAVETRVERMGPASILFAHRVLRDATAETLVVGSVKVGCVNSSMRPLRLPRDIMNAVKESAEAGVGNVR